MSSKRSIFEDVNEELVEPSANVAGGIDKGRHRGARDLIRVWLIALFTLVLTMIIVGGLTRLTDSGLSITEWRPITGAIPPFTADAWDVEFQKYQEIPEYQLQNTGMSLGEFKFIYWWEWGHRQLGRIIGLVWVSFFLFFLFSRLIPVGWINRLLLLGVLGGSQGVIGWWMVASGLSGEVVDVASYRLAIHLGIAFVILGYITWFIHMLARQESELLSRRRYREKKLFSMSTGLMHVAFLQIILGALVAGIDAGKSYSDWPLMAGGFFPPEPFSIKPLWRNFFEDDGLVQFMHRVSGYLLFIFGIIIWRRSRLSGNASIRGNFNIVMAAMLFQLLLGIFTVLYAAPWSLAILHQFGAVLLWVFILRARFLSGYPPQQNI